MKHAIAFRSAVTAATFAIASFIAPSLPGIGIGGAAEAGVVVDNFNDNTTDPLLWTIDRDTIRIKETRRKLKFKSALSGAGERASFYRANGWRFRADRSYTIRMDYKIRPPNVSGNRDVGVGMEVAIRGGGDRIQGSVWVQDDAGGLSLHVEIEVNGVVEVNRSTPIATDNGRLTVKFLRSSNRLKAQIDGVTIITVRNVLDDPNQRLLATLAIGAGRKGFVPWDWNDVWIDNFKIKGRIVN